MGAATDFHGTELGQVQRFCVDAADAALWIDE